MELSAVLGGEQDSGGGLVRRRRDSVLNLRWQQRKLLFTASLVADEETLGDAIRRRGQIQMMLRREL
jgi:hypothetical protein